MNHYDVAELADVVRELAWSRWIFETACANGRRDTEIHPIVLERAQDLWKRLHRCCVGADLNATLSLVQGRFADRLFAMGTPTSGRLITEYEVVLDTLLAELPRRHFEYVPADKWKPVVEMEQHGSWDAIWTAFPSAKYDAQEAVYCIAHGRHTACVFHLMRVAEVGLRSLARHAKITFKKGPLEWQEWGAIIRSLRAKADAIQQTGRGPKKDVLLDFYNGSLAQYDGFKDEYRNRVMHSREPYDAGQAARCLAHVHSFILKLAGRINEKGKLYRG